jgi:hypothetical protein
LQCNKNLELFFEGVAGGAAIRKRSGESLIADVIAVANTTEPVPEALFAMDWLGVEMWG